MLKSILRDWREGISNELETDSPKKCENAGEDVLECGKGKVLVKQTDFVTNISAL